MSKQIHVATVASGLPPEDVVVFADLEDGEDDSNSVGNAVAAISFEEFDDVEAVSIEEFDDFKEISHAMERENKLLSDDLGLAESHLRSRTDALLEALNTIDILRSDALTLEAERADIHFYKSQFNQLNEKIASQLEGSDDLLEQLCQSTAMAHKAKCEVDVAMARVSELESELGAVKATKATIEIELQAAGFKSKQQEAELSLSAATAQKQSGMLADAIGCSRDLEKELASARDDKVCLLASCMESEATVKRLEAERASSDSRALETDRLLREAKEQEVIMIKRVNELELELASVAKGLREQIATKDEMIDSIKGESLMKTSSTDARWDTLNKHIVDLKDRLAVKEGEIEAYARKQSELTSRLHDFEIETFEFHKKVAAERTQNAVVLAERDSLRDAGRGTAEEISLLSSQIKKADEYVSDLERACRRGDESQRQMALKLKESEQSLAALNTLNDERTTVDEQSILRITQLMERSAIAEARAAELSRSMEAVRRVHAELEDASAKRTYDMELLRSENAVYRANEIRHQNELESARRETSTLRRQLEEESAAQLRLRDRCRGLEADNAKHVDAMQIQSTYEHHFAKLNSEIEEKVAKMSSLRVAIDELMSRRQQGEEQFAAQSEEHKAGLGKLRTEIAALRARADFYEQHHAELEERVRRARASAGGLEAQEVALARAVEELKRQEKDLEIHITGRNAALQERVAACSEREAGAEAAARVARVQQEHAQKDAEESASRASISAAQLAESQRQLQAAREAVAGAGDELEKRKGILADLRADERALRDDLSTFKATLGGLMASNEDAAMRVAALSGEEDALRATLLALKSELISCQRTINGVNSELNSKRSLVDKEDQMLKELLHKRQLAEGDLRRLADLQAAASQAVDDDNRRREGVEAALRKARSDADDASDALRLLQREVVELARTEQASRAVEEESRRAAEHARAEVSRLANEAVELRLVADRLRSERFDLEGKVNSLGSSYHRLCGQKEKAEDDIKMLSLQRRAVVDTPAAVSSLRTSSYGGLSDSAYRHCSSDYLSELNRRVRGLSANGSSP